MVGLVSYESFGLEALCTVMIANFWRHNLINEDNLRNKNDLKNKEDQNKKIEMT